MKRLFLSVILSITLLASMGVSVYAADVNPAGNNGFVKVSNEIMPDQIPQNHPHVSCKFDVEFYNYDKNNNKATVKFELQSPTATDGHSLQVVSGNLNPFIGGDAAGGGQDLDARETYKLKFTGTPHTNQSYHVKLTVEAPGSKGNDKKYKVFWVEPCAETTPDVLGDQTSDEIPKELPQTGFGLTGVLGLSGLVAAAGYVVSYLRQKRS